VSISSGDPGAAAPTAILLHGLGSRGSDLARVAAAIGAGTQVLTPDLRGHGDSPPRAFAAIDDFAADLEPLARGAGAALVAGFSFGAWVALELWTRAPEAVSAVVLVDPPLDHSALVEWARGQTLTSRGAMRKLGELYRTRDLADAVRLMGRHPLTRDLDEAARKANAQALLAADPGTLRGALRLRTPDVATARPPGSLVPVRVLHGSRSLVCPRAVADEMASLLGGEATVYEGGHCAHLEAPREIGAAVVGLLDLGA